MSEIPTGSARGNEWLLVKGYAVNDRLRRDQLGELRQLVQVMGRTLQILRTLKSHQGEALDDGTNVGINVGSLGYNIPSMRTYPGFIEAKRIDCTCGSRQGWTLENQVMTGV